MDPILEKLSAIGIIPVVKIDNIETAVPLVKALYEGGLPCAEITFRTSEAEEAIRIIAREFPHVLVGAGTVLTTEQADHAIDAGAKFIVSPGLNPKVVKHCQDKGILITPGTSNASDIEKALEMGLEAVKFFPAEVSGGIKAIKALAGPFTNIKFIPTGGISAKNLCEYMAFDRIIACGGSWMVDPSLVSSGNFEAVKALTREAVSTMLGFELAHIGINSENEEIASRTAKMFCRLLNLEYKEGNSSIFAGNSFELMKKPYLGKNGHIAIRTNDIARAVNYLESQGFLFDYETKKNDAKGKPAAIYLKDEISGFAIHLVQKK